MQNQNFLSRFIFTFLFALFLALLPLTPKLEAAHLDGHREGPLLKHLIYDALFDPGKSGEIRWVLADARDTADSLKTVWESGGSEGKMDLVFNTAGWIPLGGDGLKSGRRVLN